MTVDALLASDSWTRDAQPVLAPAPVTRVPGSDSATAPALIRFQNTPPASSRSRTLPHPVHLVLLKPSSILDLTVGGSQCQTTHHSVTSLPTHGEDRTKLPITTRSSRPESQDDAVKLCMSPPSLTQFLCLSIENEFPTPHITPRASRASQSSHADQTQTTNTHTQNADHTAGLRFCFPST